MAISVKQGNLLDAKEDIIMHQVNCKGVMGSGVARCIKEKWPKTYAFYKEYVKFNDEEFGDDKDSGLLGTVLWDKVEAMAKGDEKYIAHIFGQYDYRKNGSRECMTDYEALSAGLWKVGTFAKRHGYSIAMPYGIGCGRGGGDWDGVVFPMLCGLFSHGGECEDVKVVLYQL